MYPKFLSIKIPPNELLFLIVLVIMAIKITHPL
nr:MAG TPA: hypothetical protein [Caudoviricetes sp.]